MSDVMYKAFPTAVGKAKIAAAILHGERVNFTHIAVGDGAGAYYIPADDQVALLNECWRGEISAYEISAVNPNMITVRTVIPAGAATFTAREGMLIDSDGDGVAIWNMPSAELPPADSGASFPLTVAADIIVEDATVVTITVNPTMEPVSREELTQTLMVYAKTENVAPIMHAARHATDGEDPLAPEDIGAAAALHAARHAAGGEDPLTPEDIDAADREHTHGLADVFGSEVTTVPLLMKLLGAVRIESGSYTGTGAWGSSNPNSITFDFVPKLVVVGRTTTDMGIFFPSLIGGEYRDAGWLSVRGSTASLITPNTSSYEMSRVVDTTMSWYINSGSTDRANEQFNSADVTYHWWAIG